MEVSKAATDRRRSLPRTALSTTAKFASRSANAWPPSSQRRAQSRLERTPPELPPILATAVNPYLPAGRCAFENSTSASAKKLACLSPLPPIRSHPSYSCNQEKCSRLINLAAAPNVLHANRLILRRKHRHRRFIFRGSLVSVTARASLVASAVKTFL